MQTFLLDYGIRSPVRMGKRALEAFAYMVEHPEERGGLGAYGHFRNYIALTWPGMVAPDSWNPWLEWRMRTFCDPVLGVTRRTQPQATTGQPITTSLFRFNNYAGCAASGKSHDLALFAMAWWSVAPSESAVILCSTSKLMVRRRAWATLQKLYHEAVDAETGKRIELGYMLDSQTTLCAVKGDMKHAIMALAVEGGELQQSIGKAKGIHARRLMVAIDEADSCPAAILELVNNWRKGCDEFVLLAAANSVSQLDVHGQLSEPVSGWESVSVDSEMWLTKPVDKWSVDSGVLLHFDGEKSPNVRAGRTKYPFLYSFEDHLGARARPEYAQSVQYWSMDRGYWPPDGAVDRVITPQKIIRHHGRERFTWTRRAEPCAALDPAFGGNTCVLQFGTLGDATLDRNVLELADFVEILPAAVSDLPVDAQIARRVMLECKKRGVDPSHFGMDCTGTGRGVAAILAMEWSNQFVRVEFGGQASDHVLSSDSKDTARDLYANRVTELWFRVALLLEANKLRGLPQRTCQELCSRPFKRMGRRLVVEPKEKCKELHGKSPDCFVAGTLVKTDQGDRPIELLRVSDMVATPFGFSPVMAVHCAASVMPRTHLQFADGSTLEGLSSHRVYTHSRSWLPLDACSIGMEVESVHARPLWQILSMLLTRADATGFKAQADTIKTADTAHLSAFFTVGCGSTIMVLFLKGMWSIMSMATGATTTSAISSLCQKQIMVGSTGTKCARIRASEPSRMGALWLHAKLQKLGMLLRQVGNGIGNTADWLCARFSRNVCVMPVSCAANASTVTLPDQQHFAQTCAARGTTTASQSTSKSANVLNAVVRLAATTLNRPKRVVARTAVCGRSSPQSVYCVTLQSENAFYANGVLVENCADACSVLVEVARQHGVLPGRLVTSTRTTHPAVAERTRRINAAWEEVGSAADAVTEPDQLFGVAPAAPLTQELEWSN